MEFGGMNNSYNEQEPIKDNEYWRLIKKSAIYSIAIVLINVLSFASSIFLAHKLLPDQTISSIVDQFFQQSKWDLIYIPIGMIVFMWSCILIVYIGNKTPKNSKVYNIIELLELIMVILYAAHRLYRGGSSDAIGTIIAIVVLIIVLVVNKKQK